MEIQTANEDDCSPSPVADSCSDVLSASIKSPSTPSTASPVPTNGVDSISQLTNHSSATHNPQKRASNAFTEYSNVGDASFKADSVSMASRTSRSSRFVRKLSVRKSKASAWLSSKLRKHQRGNDLSATFNLLDQESKGALVNLNTATEEELMTVRGITRAIAHSIVEYREAIGAFKQLQDLALVSGIGAARLSSFGQDLIVGEPRPNVNAGEEADPPSTPPSIASAPSPRLASQYSTPCRSSISQPPSSTSPLKKVNINTASIFELMTVPGVNQEMAANILHHREKKGPYKYVGDVSKVRGMRPKVTRHLLPHLTVSGTSEDAIIAPGYNSSLRLDLTPINSVPKTKGHRRTCSAPQQRNGDPAYTPDLESNFIEEESFSKSPLFTKRPQGSLHLSPNTGHRLSLEFSSDVYDLLSLRSERPEIRGLFQNQHNGRSAIRIATWNLGKLTIDKIGNPGVMEVVCRTVLERGFSILALQDILAPKLLELICIELNCGTLRRVREWSGKKGVWSCIQSTDPVSSYALYKSGKRTNVYSGFLYNTNLVELLDNNLVECECTYVSKPFIVCFKANNLNFTAVNLHLKLQNYMLTNDSYLHSILDMDETFQSALDISLSEAESLDNIKKSKNLHNGLIKESQAREDLSVPLSSHSSRRLLTLSFSSTDGEGAVEELRAAMEALRTALEEETHRAVVVLGDLATCSWSEGYLRDLQPLLPPNTPTTLTNSPTPSDNICLSASLAAASAGEAQVIREGLSHLAIPKGWGWGGLASTHCPVYADLYSDQGV